MFKEGLRSSWGFSSLVETSNEVIMFDTGGNGHLLSFNMKKLSINPKKIGKLVLSHPHMDHVGGLRIVLDVNRSLTLYLPKSFPSKFKAELGNIVKLVEVDEPMEIGSGVYTTGQLGWMPKEQSLVLKMREGNVIIAGCAHPGVKSILDRAREFDAVWGIVGGLHGFNEFELLRSMKLICPCHCTQHKKKLAEIFPNAYVECGAGREIQL